MLTAVGVIVCAVCAWIGYELAAWYGPKVGITVRNKSSGGRRTRLWIVAMIVAAIAVALIWSLDAVAGLVVLIVGVVVPQFVLVAHRMRAARRQTDAARQLGRPTNHADS